MRALVVLVLAGVALAVPVAASAAYPQAWGATQQYLNAATSSCAGLAPKPGGACTQLETFTVTMGVLAFGKYRLEVQNMVPHGNFQYFAWLLPDGMTLTGVTGAHGGSCGTSGGMISCKRVLAAHGRAQRNLVVNF